MTVKLVLLKSGEDVVADIQEMVSGDVVVGYFFKHPCRVKLYGDQIDSDGSNRAPFKMQLTPWMPLSKDEYIPVVSDWVISMVEPIDQLKEMYERGIKNYESRKPETTGVDEQSDSSESD